MRTLLLAFAAAMLLSGQALAHGPAACVDVFICEHTDTDEDRCDDAGGPEGCNDPNLLDKISCAPPDEGDTPVVTDLQEEGQACGCADVGPVGFIAGRASAEGVVGCAGAAGETHSTIDTGAPDVLPLLAADTCAATAVAGCQAGGCASVEIDSDDCAADEEGE